MLARVLAGSVCLLMVLCSSCAPLTQLPVATPQSTPVPPTITPTPELSPTPAPSATRTSQPTTIPTGAINAENVDQVRLLHQYWLALATEADVDPYEMDTSALAASPDGSLIAVGGCSKPLESDLRSGNVFCDGKDAENPDGVPFILILDSKTENVVGTVPEDEPGTTVADLVFTPDGKKLIYAVYPGKVAIWDVAAREVESVLWEGDATTPRIAVSPDGRWIAVKTTDQVQIWDTSTEEFVAEFPGYFQPQFSVDSRKLLVYHDRQFVVHETDTWAETLRFGMPCDCVYAISPDLSLLATAERATSETPILIWDTETGEQVQSLEAGKGFTAFLAFTPDGRMLWRASEHGDLTAWDTDKWDLLAEHIGGITPVFNLHGFQFTGDGRSYLLFSDLLVGLYGVP
ncbi:MAG TPA: hypothetical protein VHP14_05150 [Anaerolineales bacterium]|nr:hypothetical protein [Anaerolineales bacterium]